MPSSLIAPQPLTDGTAALPLSTLSTRPSLVRWNDAPKLPAAPVLHDTVQRLADRLGQLPLFEVLPEALRQLLAMGSQVRRMGRDDLVVRQGETDSALFVLLSGRAFCERTGDQGREVLLDVLEPGARIGEMCLIDGQAHNASVRCMTACEVLVLRGADVHACLSRNADFRQAWCVLLVQRLRSTNGRIVSMSVLGVRERVMLRLQQTSEQQPGEAHRVSARIGRTELARMVGASREMVCRVLRGLESEGLVTLHADRSIGLHFDPID